MFGILISIFTLILIEHRYITEPNSSSGGGGPAGEGEQYLYVLLKK